GTSPRRTSRPVEQQVRLEEITYATCQSIEPPHLGIDGAGTADQQRVKKCRAVANTGPVKHVANANHPRGYLVIAADLTTTSKATVAAGDARTVNLVGHLQMSPGATDIAPEVASGPNIRRRRRRRRVGPGVPTA